MAVPWYIRIKNGQMNTFRYIRFYKPVFVLH